MSVSTVEIVILFKPLLATWFTCNKIRVSASSWKQGWISDTDILLLLSTISPFVVTMIVGSSFVSSINISADNSKSCFIFQKAFAPCVLFTKGVSDLTDTLIPLPLDSRVSILIGGVLYTWNTRSTLSTPRTIPLTFCVSSCLQYCPYVFGTVGLYLCTNAGSIT